MSDERRMEVLRAIVEDYVATSEPVGSRALVERHALGVSSATIRNDMAALEDSGYIAQPHTSAGRIPTDKGYRVFVDRLTTVKPLSAPEKRAISAFLEDAVDLDDVVDRSVRLLAQLTHQVAVVQYPSLRRSTLRHVELVPVGQRHLLVVLITDTGRVEQRTLEASRDLDEVVVAQLRATVNARVAGRRVAELAGLVDDLADQYSADDLSLLRRVVTLVEETLTQESEERVVLAGTANLARSKDDFARSLGPVLEALEEQVVLMRLLSDMAEDSATVSVRIGHETKHDGLVGTSFVTSGYGDEGGTSIARVGAIGPTRMDYPATMASVRAVARYLTRILAG